MTPFAILILSLSMSADAFAAAIGRGAAHRPTGVQAVKAGLIFGLVEGLTPLIGWGVGVLASGLVEAIDHWIAFGLLGLVGVKMIMEAILPNEEDDAAPRRAGLLALIAVAVGTSIDAAAVGVGLAFIGENIWIIAASIGLTTFTLATLGMIIGAVAGARVGRAAEFLGGLALIAIGAHILIDHMGWPF